MGMTGSGMISGVVMAGSGAGVLGGEDSFGSAERDMIVGDGSGLVWGTAKGGEAAKDEKGSENFRGRL